MDQFIFGMLVALLFQTRKLGWTAALLGLVGSAAGLAIALTVFHQLGGYPVVAWYKILWPTIEGLLWAAFIYCYLNLFRTTQPLLMRLLAWIGELSYSLYLTHLIVIAVLLRQQVLVQIPGSSIIGSALITTLAIVFPLAIALAMLTYHLIEKPFLELRRVYLQRPADRPAEV